MSAFPPPLQHRRNAPSPADRWRRTCFCTRDQSRRARRPDRSRSHRRNQSRHPLDCHTLAYQIRADSRPASCHRSHTLGPLPFPLGIFLLLSFVRLLQNLLRRCGTGILPVFHGRDAHATRFARTFVLKSPSSAPATAAHAPTTATSRHRKRRSAQGAVQPRLHHLRKLARHERNDRQPGGLQSFLPRPRDRAADHRAHVPRFQPGDPLRQVGIHFMIRLRRDSTARRIHQVNLSRRVENRRDALLPN